MFNFSTSDSWLVWIMETYCKWQKWASPCILWIFPILALIRYYCVFLTVAYSCHCHSMKQFSWVICYKTAVWLMTKQFSNLTYDKTAVWPMTKHFSNLTYDKTAVWPMINLQLDLCQNNWTWRCLLWGIWCMPRKRQSWWLLSLSSVLK